MISRVIPKRLEQALLSYVKKAYLPEHKLNPKYAEDFTLNDIKFFARGVALMSSYFTSERSELPQNYLNKKELRAGYILYFVMPNFLKAYFCLSEADVSNRFKDLAKIRIADVGCGPGTASLACAEYFREAKKEIEITAVDQNTHALHDAKRLFASFAGENARMSTEFVRVHHKNISYKLKGRYNIIIMANFLSELSDIEKQREIVTALYAKNLEENGIIIIIEPALRFTTRNLMKLRDELVTGQYHSKYGYEERHPENPQLMTVLAPCLHDKACPMLIDSGRDWCHLYLDWQRPNVIAQIDRLIGNSKDYLKFSYLILQKMSQKLAEDKNVWRVVSAPMHTKGKTELLLCNIKGLKRATRLDRNLSDLNRDMDRIFRGELVFLDTGEIIEKNTKFRRLFSRLK